MNSLSKTLFFSIITMFLLAGSAIAQQSQTAPGGQDYTPPAQSEWFCPWCGGPGESGQGFYRDHMGEYGHMRGYGHMMGPYWDDPYDRDYYDRPRNRYDRRPPMMHSPYWGRGGRNPDRGAMMPLGEQDARFLVKNYIEGNKNLKIGEVQEKSDSWIVTIVTQDDSLVDKIEVNKDTGWLRRID